MSKKEKNIVVVDMDEETVTIKLTLPEGDYRSLDIFAEKRKFKKVQDLLRVIIKDWKRQHIA